MRKSAPRKTAEEDIEAVLSRFQAWSGSKNAAHESPPSSEGVREISYDEALESSRTRWKRQEATAQPTATTVASSSQRGSEMQRSVPAQRVAQGSASIANPVDENAGTQTAPPRNSVSLKTRPTPPARPSARTAARVPAAASGAVRGVVERTSLRQEFQAVLAQSVEISEPVSPRPRRETERQVSMSLRVAISEQALIRRRAADAGVSASAYLRQCALDVETLRAQVQQLMAAAARSRLAEYSEPPRTPVPEENEGWFSRWQRRIWGAPTRQLSLKA